jgi:hypothetical protein
MGKGWLWACVVGLVVAVSIGVPLLLGYWDRLSALKHETSRWAVIEDVNGDRMAVEPSKDEVWSQLVELYESGQRRWVGGIVERYDSKWGFRFKPETVRVAEVTAEGLQATIRHVSQNLDYWLGGWCYIGARVVEIHSS